MNASETSPQNTDWQLLFLDEINHAEQARLAGNEGKARVCARRAAGILAGEYLQRHGYPVCGPSAYDRLNDLISVPELPAHIREISSHFLIRVTPDWKLPIEADLISDALRLAEELFGIMSI